MGENFQLKWNDHHSIFFSTAEALCQGDHLTDVTLSCGKKEFSAHKLVLSICSTYFKELFSPRPDAKPRPANQAAIVYLKDVDPRHMELLMNFMYRGEINVEETELMELLGTAKGLQIRGLTDAGETSEEDDDAPPIPVHSESTSSNNHHRGAASTSSSHINKPAPKSIKRSKSPSTSQASTSGAKKIKQETSVGSAGVVQPDPAYAEDDYEQEEEEPVYVQDEGEEHLAAGGDEEGEYNMEDSGGEAMLYEGDLTTPELQQPVRPDRICDICYKAFPSKYNMHMHRRSHTGEKPFICDMCPAKFNQAGNLKRHYMTVHAIKYQEQTAK